MVRRDENRGAATGDGHLTRPALEGRRSLWRLARAQPWALVPVVAADLATGLTTGDSPGAECQITKSKIIQIIAKIMEYFITHGEMF